MPGAADDTAHVISQQKQLIQVHKQILQVGGYLGERKGFCIKLRHDSVSETWQQLQKQVVEPMGSEYHHHMTQAFPWSTAV